MHYLNGVNFDFTLKARNRNALWPESAWTDFCFLTLMTFFRRFPTVGPVLSISNDWNTSYGSTCWTIQLSPGSFSTQGLPATLSLSFLFCLKHSILKRPWKKPVNNIFLKLRWPPTNGRKKTRRKVYGFQMRLLFLAFKNRLCKCGAENKQCKKNNWIPV